MPALPTRLLPMLVQNIPHKLRDRPSQCLFLRALILLAEGKVGCDVLLCWFLSLRIGLLLLACASSCASSYCWRRARWSLRVS